MAVKFRDYYEILGVSRTTPQDDIQKAYRKLARKYHPDVNKDAGAEDKFKELNEAYEVLRDPEKRKKYDQLGANWKAGQEFTPPPGWDGAHFDFGGARGGGGGMSDFSDFFESLFGGAGEARGGRGFRGFGGGRAANLRRRGQDHEAEIELTLSELVQGGTRKIDLAAHVPQPDGRVRMERQSYDVTIPKGIADGSRIRLAGQGSPGIGGGEAGDLFLKVRLRSDARFSVEGHHLRTTLPLAPWEAALGAEVRVETLDGKVTVTVPPGSQSGQALRLRGKGLPKRAGEAGDLFVALKIVVPKSMTPRERELYESLARESAFRARPEEVQA